MKKLFVLVSAVVAMTAFAQDKAAAKAKTEITWWGHAAWVIKTPGGATIAIDPWLTNPKAPKDAKQPETLDAILITHGHFDHVGDAAALQKKTNAKVIGAYELVGLLGVGEAGMGGNIGGQMKIKDATITLVEALHSSGWGQDPKTPYAAGSAMGYIIQIENGPTLYHAGDTDVFMGMSLIADRYKPTHAMLPIGGHFTMDPNGAALAAKMLKVKTVVPMHFGTFPALTGTPDQLKAALKKTAPGATMVEAKIGEPIAL